MSDHFSTGRGCKCVLSENVLNFCANNYLGLANHPDSKQLKMAYRVMALEWPLCVLYVVQDNHKVLERKISEFLGMEDTILYSSCFDANAGLFETIRPEDAVISDALNHASIIDGVRLAKRYRYDNNDMKDLEAAAKTSH